MSHLPQKLRGRRGETLAEVLVAMLVVALAVLLLASMVTAAGSINTATRVKDEQFYKELTAAETFAAPRPSSGDPYQVHITQVTPTAAPGGPAYTPAVPAATADVPVDAYGSDNMMTFK